MKYSIGCDPECFVWDQKSKQFLSAHGMVRGTKRKPLKVPKGAVQVDGTALEFNIEPAYNLKEFLDNIDTVINELRKRVKARAEELELVFTPHVEYNEQVWKNIPKEALRLGCDPDFDAYSQSMNEPPIINNGIRTASGHIHVGWTENNDVNDPSHYVDCIRITRQLDMIMGRVQRLWDDDPVRAQWYGKLGTFRPKPYGVEYRTLSNVWLKDKKLQAWVFRSTQHAMHLLDDDIHLEQQLHNVAPMMMNDPKELHMYMVEEYDCPQLPKEYL